MNFGPTFRPERLANTWLTTFFIYCFPNIFGPFLLFFFGGIGGCTKGRKCKGVEAIGFYRRIDADAGETKKKK